MSSKADDFDVRYSARGSAARRPGGAYRDNPEEIDFDLGYDSPGWDTQGFRKPDFGERAAGRERQQSSMSGPGQSRTRSTPKRTSVGSSQGHQLWLYILWGVSICILLFSGYVVYRSQRDDGLITTLAEIGTFLGGLGTFGGTIVKIWEILNTK
jgi:hypothetical protein